MMIRRIISLLILLTLGISVVCGMYVFAERTLNKPNGFVRTLPPFKIKPIRPIYLGSFHFYFAGVNKEDFFLANTNNLRSLLKITSHSGTTTCLVDAPKDLKVYNDVQLLVDAGHLYLTDGIKGIYGYGSLKTATISKIIQLSPFTAFTPVNKHSAIVRVITTHRENILARTVGEQIVIPSNLLEKQIDGIFCTDGQLIKLPGVNRICYTYYYRNQFFVADTNMNLIFHGKTIDTASHADIKLGHISSDGEWTLASPPHYVNKQIAANDKNLFVWSALAADNELKDIMDENAVIDVYAINNGKYKFSFYLPDFEGEKLSSFAVSDTTLCAIFGNYLYRFKLNF